MLYNSNNDVILVIPPFGQHLMWEFLIMPFNVKISTFEAPKIYTFWPKSQFFIKTHINLLIYEIYTNKFPAGDQ